MSEAFDRLVADYQLTCPSVPTQYEGTLAGGRVFYFCYRSGRAEMGFGQTEDAAVLETIDPATPYLLIGDQYDGELDEDEFKQAFTELVGKRTIDPSERVSAFLSPGRGTVRRPGETWSEADARLLEGDDL